MNFRLTIFSMLILLGIQTFATERKEFSPLELKEYFSEHADFILFESEKYPENFSFIVSDDLTFPTIRLKPLNYRDPLESPPAFSFDIQKFLIEQNARDLRTAKLSYVKKLKFKGSDYQYERSFLHFNAWGSLFHPPVNLIKIRDASQVDSGLGSPQDLNHYGPKFQLALDQQTGTELTNGNETHLLQDGRFNGALIELIENADDFIFINMLSADCKGKTAGQIFSKLKKKAKEGTKIWYVTDGVVCKIDKPLPRRPREKWSSYYLPSRKMVEPKTLDALFFFIER